MEIIIDPVNQFIFSLNQLFCDKSKEKLTEDLIDYYNDIEGNISPLLFSDLKYFFKDTGLGTILYQSYTTYDSIDTYFNYLTDLANSSKDEIIEQLLTKESYLKELYENVGYEKFVDRVQELYDSTNNKYNIKDGLIELYNYPSETINRNLNALRRYYKDHYSKIENHILDILNRESKRLKPLLTDEEITEKELKRIGVENVDLNDFDKGVFLSYFPFSMLTISVNTLKKTVSLIFNYKYAETLDPVKKFEKSVDFLKTISDDTRMKIIRLLASKKCYSSEIAKEVGLNRGTVSYHMEKLKKDDAIKYSFSKKRIYYSLHKERFKEMFDSFLNGLEILEKEENEEKEQ